MPHSIVIPESNTALTHDLTTVEAVNAALDLTSSTAADVETAAQITSFSLEIAEACDRVFALRTVIETFMLHEHYIHGLPLHEWPVTEIASVTAGGVVLAATDYMFDPDSGLLWRWSGEGCFGWQRGTVVITYTAGYDLPSGAPASLARACIEMIADARSAAATVSISAGGMTIRDIQHGDRRVSYLDSSADKSKTNASLTASVDALIDRFRRRNV